MEKADPSMEKDKDKETASSVEDEDEYTVEKILKRRQTNGKRHKSHREMNGS